MTLLTIALIFLLKSARAAPNPPPLTSDASAQASPQSAALVSAARARIAADDLKGALQDADAAVAAGGGADAYAVRADAKRALGRPLADALEDYAAAAKLDSRYAQTYDGLVNQRNTSLHPDSRSSTVQKGAAGISLRAIAVLGGIGTALFLLGAVALRR